MQKITPNLWFDNNAEEAVDFYVSIFPDSKITNVARYTESGSKAAGQPVGSVMAIDFELHGQVFMALNGGPNFQFSPAISFMVECKTQEELDELWEKLCEGGEEWPCGWLKDKFGVSWQIVPTLMSELMPGIDPERQERVMKAMLPMTKIDIAALQRAYDGE